MITQEENFVWSDTFSTNQAIEPALGTFVYTDANTCPIVVHGANGIATYEYEVKVNNQIAKIGAGTISDNFEDLT